MTAVSVIIPTYNCAHTIRRAIDSAQKQTFKDIQIIVIDDCSSDYTLDVLKQYNDISVIRKKFRSGAASARNTGIEIADGEYIAFLDADDEWVENKLELQLQTMEEHKNRIGLVTCNSSWIDLDQSTPIVKDYYNTHIPHAGKRVWVNLLEQNFIPTPTVLTRSAVLKQIGGFNENLPIAEDYDLWIRIARQYRIEYRKEVLVKFYEREKSLMKEFSDNNMMLTLSVIKEHIDKNRMYLKKSEVNNILGRRMHGYAYEAYLEKRYNESIMLCQRSLECKYKIFKNILLVLRCFYKMKIKEKSND